MLACGEINALYTARMPSTFTTAPEKVKRLFPNYEQVEKQSYRDTGIFPMMHTVAIRREVYEQHRWIAQSLYKEFVAAQRATYEDLYVTAALKLMLPWLTAHVEDARAVLGEITADGVEVTAMHPAQRCTVASVAGHAMYERSNPYFEHVAGGTLDMSECRYEQVGEKTTRTTRSAATIRSSCFRPR
jgi:hypothetical protein